MVISLSAKGLTHGEICAHLAEVYGAEVSKQTISAITDRVMEGMAEWQNRPLDAVYAVVFIDAINVKIREGQVANRPIYLALGVTVDGERDVLGLWAGEHGDGEGAKFWLRVLSEIKNRGVRDVCMLVCDGLKGLPDAVSAVWEKTIVAGAVGLSNMSKPWVSGVTLAGGATSVLVLVLLPWVNWKSHLRVGSDYEALYQETIACRMGHGQVDEERLAALRDRFRELTDEARRAEAQLGDRQIKRYEKRARGELPESIRQANPELLD